MNANFPSDPGGGTYALSPAAVATFLDVSERALLNLRRDDPTFPAPKMVGCLPRWTATRIAAWLDDVPAASTSSHGPDAPTRTGGTSTDKVGTPATKSASTAAATTQKVHRRVQ